MAHLVLVEGDAHVAHVLALLVFLLRDQGDAEIGPVHLFQVFSEAEVVFEDADSLLSVCWGLNVAGVAEMPQGCNPIGLLIKQLNAGFCLDSLLDCLDCLELYSFIKSEGLWEAEFICQSFFELWYTVIFQSCAKSLSKSFSFRFLFIICKRLNPQFTLPFSSLNYLIDLLQSDLILSIAVDLIIEVDYDLLLDIIFSHILLLQLLHECITVGNLYLHFPDRALQGSDFLLHLLVLVEDTQRLRFEVIQLIIQAPNLVIIIPLRDGDVQLFYHLFSFLLHNLYLCLDYRKQLLLMILQPTSNVFIYLTDDHVHLLEVSLDGLL